MKFIRTFAEDLRNLNERAFARKPFFDNNSEILANNSIRMEFKKKVEVLLDQFLEGREDLFLIDLKISLANDITLILDGDNGISIQDCVDASRAIERHLNREEENFSLQVMSAGVSEPLQYPRQFRKNLGRTLDITLFSNEKYKGEVTEANDQKIVLTRKLKTVRKGKVDTVEEVEIPYTNIKKAIVISKF